MRIDAFRPAEAFKNDMDQWIRRFRSAEPVAGQPSVLVPGDPERAITAQRMQEGIPVLEAVLKDLQYVGDRFSLIL